MKRSKEDHPFKNHEFSRKKILEMSKTYNFKDLRFYKKWPGLKFNDVMVTLIMKTFKELFEQEGSKAEKLVMAIPVNMRTQPKSIEDVILSNQIVGTKFELPLVDSLDEAPRISQLV